MSAGKLFLWEFNHFPWHTFLKTFKKNPPVLYFGPCTVFQSVSWSGTSNHLGSNRSVWETTGADWFSDGFLPSESFTNGVKGSWIRGYIFFWQSSLRLLVVLTCFKLSCSAWPQWIERPHVSVTIDLNVWI